MTDERDNAMDEKKRELLTILARELNDAEDVESASLFTDEELGTDIDLVRCLVKETGADLIDTLAECFFLPLERQESVSYFTTIFTIIDEMEPEYAQELAQAVARINFFLPVGTFAVDNENGLIFKYTVPIKDEESDDDKKKDMLTAFNLSLSVVDKYEGYLMLVATDELDSEKMIDLILGR